MLLPFKIIVGITKSVTGFFGVILGAVLTVVLAHVILVALAANFDWMNGVWAPFIGGFSMAAIIEIGVFLLSIYAGYDE